MNPPFTNRSKMGEKFKREVQTRLRQQIDSLEEKLAQADPELVRFVDKNSVAPLFVGLADHCVNRSEGILTMINPTVALTAPSAQCKRTELARRFHIHTVLTSHQPKNINMSSDTSINESIIVMQRHNGSKPPTRFINLGRMPANEDEVADFHRCLIECKLGLIANGWGEVSFWPVERIDAGDWTPAVWRSPELAQAAWRFATLEEMQTVREHGFSSTATLAKISKKKFIPVEPNTSGSFSFLDSKGADGQLTIQSKPDAQWKPISINKEHHITDSSTNPKVDKLLKKAGYLLITSGQDTATARLTAVASDKAYIGRGWVPVSGTTVLEAKALAVFINSTAGRLLLMRNAGKKIAFPSYNPVVIQDNLRIPDIKDDHICRILSSCWEQTQDMLVPQFRDGECYVRRLWDAAVAEVMGWDVTELARLRLLLHQEPHVRGLGYGQY